MRIRSIVAALGALCLVAVLGAITPADAGNGNYVVVGNVVAGPVPAGTVFEIAVLCSPTNGVNHADPAGTGPVILKFDANGDPLGTNMVSATLFETCKVTETVTGGAKVSYACQISEPTNGAGPDADLDASCVDDQTVAFGEVNDAEGTVTVTNTFAEAADAEPAAAEVVQAEPTFTG